jgi:type IV pilus assembly protein PilV
MSLYRSNRPLQSLELISNHKGVGLIETMVSLFVLAIGLLGISSMQVNTMKSSQNSYYRTHATNLAYAIIDRMRVNHRAARSTSIYLSNYGQTHAGASDCSSHCRPDQIAAHDLMVWKTELKQALPKGQGMISFWIPTACVK